VHGSAEGFLSWLTYKQRYTKPSDYIDYIEPFVRYKQVLEVVQLNVFRWIFVNIEKNIQVSTSDG